MKTQTKIIMRRLPRGLTEEQFINQMSPLNKFNYFRFCSADKMHKEFASTRVYMDFCSEDDMYNFKNEFDSKLFVDSEGNESYPIIEFAVFQKIPGKNKLDTKQNSLSNDPDFIRFTQEVNEIPKNLHMGTVESNLEEIKNKETENAHVSTALIDYLTNLPKKDRGRKDDYRKKTEFIKIFPKKEVDNDFKSNKKVVNKDTASDICSKNEIVKIVEKMETKKAKPVRNDIKMYAANYEEYENDFDGYGDERSPKRGFDNRNYKEKRYDYDSGGSYYYNTRNNYGQSDGYYRGYDGYYGYSDYPQGSYSRAQASKTKRGGGKRPPPSYSTTRKD